MQTITLPLNQFLQWATHSGGTPIPEEWVPILAGHLKNESEEGYCVRVREYDGQPILWRYSEWYSDQVNIERQRAYSQKMRDERFVFEYNHKLVTRGVMRLYALPEHMASMVAMKYLRKPNNSLLLESVGVDELITDVKEIP